MKEKHTLDELFKEKLVEHSSPVPDHLWSGIVNKRGGRRASGLFSSGLFWLLVSGGLMVGTGAYLSEDFVAQNTDHDVHMVYSGLSESASEQGHFFPNDNSLNGTNNKSPETANNDSKMSSQNNESTDPEGPNRNPKKGFDGFKKNTIQGKARSVDNSQPAATKAVSAGVASSTGAEGDPLVSANTSSGSSSSGTPIKIETWGQSEGSMKNSSNELFILRTSTSTASMGGGLKATPELTLLKVRPTELNSANISSEPDLSITPSTSTHGPKKVQWFADLSAGYYTLDQKWENVNSVAKDQRVGAETFNDAIDLGLRTGIQIKNGLTLSLGVLYSKASSTVSTTSSSIDTVVTTSIDSVGSYQDTANNVLVTIWDTVTTFSFEELDNALRASNSYSLIQIPVSVGYSVQKGRFELGVNVGASFDFLVSNSSSYPTLIPSDSSINTLEDSEILALMSGKSSVRSGLSLFGNLSIAYMFSEKLHFLVEPTIRSSSIPFERGGPPYVKLNYYGVRGGLRFLF